MGRNIADRDQPPIILKTVDPGGAALCRLRNAIDTPTVSESAGIGMMPTVVEQHGRRRQRAAPLGNGNYPPDAVAHRHLFAQNSACARPRERIGKITASRLDPVPCDIAQTSAGQHLIHRRCGGPDAPPFRHQAIVPLREKRTQPSRQTARRRRRDGPGRPASAAHCGVTHKTHRQAVNGGVEGNIRAARAHRSLVEDLRNGRSRLGTARDGWSSRTAADATGSRASQPD